MYTAILNNTYIICKFSSDGSILFSSKLTVQQEYSPTFGVTMDTNLMLYNHGSALHLVYSKHCVVNGNVDQNLFMFA